MKANGTVKNRGQKTILNLLKKLEGRYSMWSLWQDFIIMSACAIANVFPHPNRDKYEEDYIQRASKYKPEEIAVFSDCLGRMVDELEENPEQDFLGELFMALGLSSDRKGQFFTPYNVRRMMSALTWDGNLENAVSERGWVGIADPTCGAGALLIAFANECRRRGFNDQSHVLYVAQDIDYIVGCMCYIQLSLLGCAGYVVIGDSLCNPITSYDDRGLIPKDSKNIWFTPMYFSNIWQGRVFCKRMGLSMMASTKDKDSSLDCIPGQLMLF